ncbi:MAG: hypothetical protein ABIB43_06245 [archaeon]
MGRKRFIVFDGLDGIGKGVAIKALIDHLKVQGLRIFDLHDFWSKHNEHPEFDDKSSELFVSLDDFDVLVSSEPTYVGIGLVVRNELTANNSRPYYARTIANGYSNDRLVLYRRVVLPVLKAGKIVVQSRSVSTSLVYQPLQKLLPGEKPLSRKEVMSLEGNAFTLRNAPDLLILATISDAFEVMKRLKNRVKDDDCKFENLDFQMKINPMFESKELKEIFESRGTIVKYLDASISIESTKKQAVEIYEEFIR